MLSQHHLIFFLFCVFIYFFFIKKNNQTKTTIQKTLVRQRKDGSSLQSWDLQLNTDVQMSCCLCSEAGPLPPPKNHHPLIGEVVGGTWLLSHTVPHRRGCTSCGCCTEEHGCVLQSCKLLALQRCFCIHLFAFELTVLWSPIWCFYQGLLTLFGANGGKLTLMRPLQMLTINP